MSCKWLLCITGKDCFPAEGRIFLASQEGGKHKTRWYERIKLGDFPQTSELRCEEHSKRQLMSVHLHLQTLIGLNEQTGEALPSDCRWADCQVASHGEKTNWCPPPFRQGSCLSSCSWQKPSLHVWLSRLWQTRSTVVSISIRVFGTQLIFTLSSPSSLCGLFHSTASSHGLHRSSLKLQPCFPHLNVFKTLPLRIHEEMGRKEKRGVSADHCCLPL